MPTEVEPNDECPVCGSSVVVESVNPLEEYCVGFACDYYRAEYAGGEVRVER